MLAESKSMITSKHNHPDLNQAKAPVFFKAIPAVKRLCIRTWFNGGKLQKYQYLKIALFFNLYFIIYGKNYENIRIFLLE